MGGKSVQLPTEPNGMPLGYSGHFGYSDFDVETR